MINHEQLKNRDFGKLEQTYTAKDTILYALGVGLGAQHTNQDQLRFLFEEAPNFAALPTMPVVLAVPGFWAREADTGILWQKVLHGEESIELHAPIPTAATVSSSMKITDIIDKGREKGALFYTERTLSLKETGVKLATIRSTILGRGDGGFAGTTGPAKPVHSLPDRSPDISCDLPTLPQAALIYRLSADRNPLHIDPEVSKSVGYASPILHGLCTLGVAGHAIIKSCCDYQPDQLKKIALRFSSPVYPGETIRTEMWLDDETVSFRATALERNSVVLNNGLAEIGNG